MAAVFFVVFLAAFFRVAFFVAVFFAAFLAAFFVVAFFVAVFLAAFLRVAFFTAFFFVAFLAGGTGTTFLRERSLKGSSNFGLTRYATDVSPAPYATKSGWRYELTRFLKSAPTVNFADLDAGIRMGSRV